MRLKYFLLAISFLLLAACQNKKEEEAIKKTFESYKKAVKSNRDSISFFIDLESKNKFIEYEQLIKHGNQNDIDFFINKQNAPLTWRYLFLAFNSIGKKLYDPDTSKINLTINLFSLAGIKILESGGIDNFEFEKIAERETNEYIVKILVKNHFKQITYSESEPESNKLNVLVKFPFRKENDMWKFNVISYFNLFDRVIIYEAKSMNMSPERYISYITANMK
jgi:hypothetical protein